MKKKKFVKNIYTSSFIAGIIAMFFSLVATYLVYFYGVPFDKFGEAAIAIAIASFFSGFFGRFYCLVER